MDNKLNVNLTPRQLAERWGCSEGHLANLRSAGKGPVFFRPTGGKVLYPLAGIEMHERERLVRSTAEDAIRREHLSTQTVEG